MKCPPRQVSGSSMPRHSLPNGMSRPLPSGQTDVHIFLNLCLVSRHLNMHPAGNQPHQSHDPHDHVGEADSFKGFEFAAAPARDPMRFGWRWRWRWEIDQSGSGHSSYGGACGGTGPQGLERLVMGDGFTGHKGHSWPLGAVLQTTLEVSATQTGCRCYHCYNMPCLKMAFLKIYLDHYTARSMGWPFKKNHRGYTFVRQTVTFLRVESWGLGFLQLWGCGV
jgi:hypothetical protein